MPLSLKQQEFDRQLDLTQIRQFKRTGDLELLGKLYQKYMPLVYGVGLKYFKDREVAQDVVMQIFEKLTIEAIKQDILNFKSWLYVVTKNHCLMELRKQNAEEGHFKNWQEEQKKIMEFGFEMHPIDDEIHLTNALKDCISKLKTEQKASIELFYYQKKCYQQIAISLKIEEKSVKSNIQNGKRNLKICLENQHVR